MARADTPEDQRVDFSLYVDEFQNFATDSFESIMSEARKYKLSLIMGNQFMTQLTDKIREAIIGNVGTIISGRIGVTDAELMVKKFQPVFDVDDLTKLPNFQSIASVMINNVPSAPFSMNWVAPMGVVNRQLKDALIKLSAAKYGRPRAEVEREIFKRLDQASQSGAVRPGAAPGRAAPALKSQQGSFLDEWLAKRQQLNGNVKMPPGSPATSFNSTPAIKPTAIPPRPLEGNLSPSAASPSPQTLNTAQEGEGKVTATATVVPEQPASASAAQSIDGIKGSVVLPDSADSTKPVPERLNLRDGNSSDEEIQINLR